jgi:hypothetical protein
VTSGRFAANSVMWMHRKNYFRMYGNVGLFARLPSPNGLLNVLNLLNRPRAPIEMPQIELQR